MDPVIADRLAKCLRMLTSSYDGEILSAAGKINGILAAHDFDWSDILAGHGRDLSREQMTEIYNEAYARGLADGPRSVAPAVDDWAPARTPRTDEVGSRLNEVVEIIDAIELHGGNDFETQFCSDKQDRLDRWGRRTFVTDKQWAVLDRIKTKLKRYGHL